MANRSALGALYSVASDSEAGVLDMLTRRADLIWTCAFCRWYNPSNAKACEGCGRSHADSNAKEGTESTDPINDDATLTPLFNYASDGEAALLDDLSRRANLIWTCLCHWHNPARADICESCGRFRASTSDNEMSESNS